MILNRWFNRLIVTDNAQCGAWNTWCAANKKSRNAKISHAEHPARSDAVKFFYYTLDSDPFKHFEFKTTLYRHFQNLLSTPEKVLLLTDSNFASKKNRHVDTLPVTLTPHTFSMKMEIPSSTWRSPLPPALQPLQQPLLLDKRDQPNPTQD